MGRKSAPLFKLSVITQSDAFEKEPQTRLFLCQFNPRNLLLENAFPTQKIMSFS